MIPGSLVLVVVVSLVWGGYSIFKPKSKKRCNDGSGCDNCQCGDK